VIVLDTHAWLWWAGDHERLPPRLRRRLAADDDLVISAISCWEAAMLVERGRLTLAPDARSGIRRATTVPNLRVMDVTEAIATDAGLLGAAFHGDPADRIVVATALHLKVPLVTKDERIRSSRRVETLW
jgi:PIN domain nuclease of toxin-antitoxin system